MEFRKIPSLDYRYEVNEDGTVFRNCATKKESKIKLDMHHSKTGYYTTFVHIGGRRPDSYCKRVMIHKVVAECWLGECPDGMEVDHIDRNSLNNDYRNLRYVTRSEQMKNRDHTRISAQGKQNLHEARMQRAIGVILTKDNIVQTFESVSACARYLADTLPLTINQTYYKLKNRNTQIYDYEVTYASSIKTRTN